MNNVSTFFDNVGTDKYKRVYAEVSRKKLCEEGECKHEKGEKSIFTRIADKKQQAGERTGIPEHTQIKGKGDER